MLRVGLVGAHPARGWGLLAHRPALAALPGYALTAVSARSQELADAAAPAFGDVRAFGDSLALVRDPEVDVVAVTVKVPEHRAVVLAALAAGKHVYCEWPLGRDLAETRELAAAVPAGQHLVVGLQGQVAPELVRAARLLADGAIGRPLVARVYAQGGAWGTTTGAAYGYLQDRDSGAGFEAIGVGHVLPAVESLVGAYTAVDAVATTRVPRVPVEGTDEVVERTCADHLLLLGAHASGCVSTLEVVGGRGDRPAGFEVVGEHGWLRLTGAAAGPHQLTPLALESSAPIPDLASDLPPQVPDGPPRNVAGVYAALARDLARDAPGGGSTAPSASDAVRLSALLDAISTAARTGVRQHLPAPAEPTGRTAP